MKHIFNKTTGRSSKSDMRQWPVAGYADDDTSSNQTLLVEQHLLRLDVAADLCVCVAKGVCAV